MRRSTRSEPATLVAAGLVVLLLVVLVVVPLVRLVQVVAESGWTGVGSTLQAPGVGRSIVNTLVLSIVVTMVAVPLGAAMTLALRRSDLPARGALRLGVLLPLLVPQFVLGYSWTQAYGRGGFTDDLLGVSWPLVLGPIGVAVVLVVNAVPVVALLVAAGLATRAEPDLERAARASGASGWTALRTITLPLLNPSLAAAAVLTFVVTLESFAIPQVMGAASGFTTITTRIYRDLAQGSDPRSFVEAVTLALLLVVLAAAVVGPADAVLGPRLRTERAAQPPGAPVITARTTGSRALAWVIAGYLALTVVMPSLSLLAAAVTRGIGLPPTPDNWTLSYLRGALTGPAWTALSHSLQLAAVGASVLVLLGALVAALERGRRGRVLGAAVTLTLVLPGTTLAVGLLIAYGEWLGDTLSIILLAYLAKLWAFAHRPIAGALDRLPPAETQAARASGAGLLTAIRTVVARPLLPALIGAWLLVFVTALHEITMSSLLYGPRSVTLAVVVLNNQELGQVGSTAAISVLLTLLLLVPAVPLLMIIRRLQRVRSEPAVDGRRVSEVAGAG
ncbi:MAG: ABC transporter permease subunit [Actinomycetes bacterium]